MGDAETGTLFSLKGRPLLILGRFQFVVVSVLAWSTSDPLAFIQWPSTTKVVNRDQPLPKMKAGLCDMVNTTHSDLIYTGLGQIQKDAFSSRDQEIAYLCNYQY